MTIYTTKPDSSVTRPLANLESGLGESLSAEFAEGFREGPLNSWARASQADALNMDPESPRMTKDEAEAGFKTYGVKSINVPPQGISKAFYDNVISETRNRLEREAIIQSAPSGIVSSPLKFVANLGGNMVDPGNLAIGLVPFFGQARSATMLGRAAERFGQGAVMGGAQTAATLPFTAMGAAAEGDNYTIGDAGGNLLMGMIAGGALHAGGGFIADMVRGRRQSSDPGAVDAGEPAIIPVDSTMPAEVIPPPRSLDIVPAENSRSELNNSISKSIDDYAYSTGYSDVVPDFIEQRRAIAGQQIDNVNSLRSELTRNNQLTQSLDATLKERTSAYQAERMKFKEAQAKARQDIAEEKAALESRNAELQQQIDNHVEGAKAAQDIADISKGIIPESAKPLIEQRAQQIREGLQESPLARGVRTASQRFDDADISIRENAMRAAIAQAKRGEDINVDPFFDLMDPVKRPTAIEQLSRQPQPQPDPVAGSVSAAAEQQAKRATREDADFINAQEDFEAELNILNSLADSADNAKLREELKTIRQEANDTSLQKGIQAAAGCMIGKM